MKKQQFQRLFFLRKSNVYLIESLKVFSIFALAKSFMMVIHHERASVNSSKYILWAFFMSIHKHIRRLSFPIIITRLFGVDYHETFSEAGNGSRSFSA